jgi:branched-chain amino acid transport system permease protein
VGAYCRCRIAFAVVDFKTGFREEIEVGQKRATGILLLVLLLTGLAFFPCYAPPYFVSFAAIVLMFVILSQAWNLFSGLTGYVSFGHHVFFGIGSYASAILISRYGASIYLTMWAGAGSAAVLALLISVATLRLKGAYFSLSTLAVAVAVALLFENISSITRGARGITLPPKYNLIEFFYVMLALAIVSVAIAFLIKNSKVGLALSGIRGDEELAASIGVDSFKYKLLTLILSAILWAVAGNFYAWYVTYIQPSDAFDIQRLASVIVSVLIGGAGSIGGAVFGAVAFGLINELLWARFPTIYLMILGIVVVFIVRFSPEGLLKGSQVLIRKMRR